MRKEEISFGFRFFRASHLRPPRIEQRELLLRRRLLSPSGWASVAAFLFLLPPISAFLTMNFTGSSTFTSLSGVVMEMKTAVPLMILSGVLGFAAMTASFILKG